MTYDSHNNLLTIIDPKSGTVSMTYDTMGNILTQRDALNKTTTFQYNSLNQMTQVTDPLGNITHYTYDFNGNRLSSTDANRNATQSTYNYKNMLTQITDALNNVTSMAYGTSGCSSCSGVDKLTSLTDAKNQTTAYEYDQAGRLTKETDSLGKITTYTYDSKGNMHTRTSPDNKTITYTYDLNNRLTQKLYSDNTVAAFQYDDAGNIIYAGNSGGIAYKFTYDNNNRITQITDSNGRTISYQYDAAGNRSTMTTPDSRQLTYAYNFNNLLTGITTTDVGNFTFAYDANNRRTTRTMPNGTVSVYSYDNASRLTGIQTTLNSTTIDSLTYTLDNVGNRKAKTQNVNTYNYIYDNIYRLTQATPSTGTQENFTYDAVGNRQTSGHEQFPQTNATTVYSYDDENRLTGVTITQGSNVKQLAFAYDPFGRRISKTIVQDTIGKDCTAPNVCPRTFNYVYDGQNIILEYDQNGNVTAKYTHGPNIDEPLAVQKGGNTYYYHADGLGSITGLSNTGGTIVQTYSYDSFGNITASSSISQPFTFTAREYDSETGMYFYRARYYDPKVGRFVTKDPIGFGGGDVNLYNYVGANPVNWIDPFGLDWNYDRSTNTLNQTDKNGKVVNSWTAVSGPWGNGQLPPGDYTLPRPPVTVPKSHPKQSSYCDSAGKCWWQPIKTKFSTKRKSLGIHPDGNKPGTQGCIGATDKDTSTLRDALTNDQGTLTVR
jgi:RHS repeat-associated protein